MTRAQSARTGRWVLGAAAGALLLSGVCCCGLGVWFWNDVPEHSHQTWHAAVAFRGARAEGRREMMGRCGMPDGHRDEAWVKERALESACHRLCRRLGEVTVDFVGASQCEVDCEREGAPAFRCEDVTHAHGRSNGDRFADDLFRVPVH